MSRINSQVRMGPSLAEAPRRMGYIRNLGALIPPPPPPLQPAVTTLEGVGLAGGIGFALLGLVIKGPARFIFAVIGGLTAVAAGSSAVIRAVSKPAAPAPAPAKPNPLLPLGPAPTPQQLVQLFNPVTKALTPAPAPAPAPSSPMITSYSQIMPPPAPSDSGMVMSYDEYGD